MILKYTSTYTYTCTYICVCVEYRVLSFVVFYDGLRCFLGCFGIRQELATLQKWPPSCLLSSTLGPWDQKGLADSALLNDAKGNRIRLGLVLMVCQETFQVFQVAHIPVILQSFDDKALHLVAV